VNTVGATFHGDDDTGFWTVEHRQQATAQAQLGLFRERLIRAGQRCRGSSEVGIAMVTEFRVARRLAAGGTCHDHVSDLNSHTISQATFRVASS
jgi:hypothetical protein